MECEAANASPPTAEVLFSIRDNAYEHTLLQWRKVNEPTKVFDTSNSNREFHEVVLAKHQDPQLGFAKHEDPHSVLLSIKIFNSVLPSMKILISVLQSIKIPILFLQSIKILITVLQA